MNIREPWRYTDPVLGAQTVIYTDDRGFVQISIKHATDRARVMATRIRDDALQALIDELIAAQLAISEVESGEG